LDELYRDLLIHVTGFFREPETFLALRKHVYPKLFEGRKPDNPIRIWVAGCSTGEEVYSIAITLLEYMWVHSRNISQAATAVQIFATDISDTALDRARTGLYPEAAVSEISAERLKRFSPLWMADIKSTSQFGTCVFLPSRIWSRIHLFPTWIW
jgi:two-component system CheB/CheR fusion protein